MYPKDLSEAELRRLEIMGDQLMRTGTFNPLVAPKPMRRTSADESVGVADPTTGDPEPGQGASPATKSPT
jgi:hypothetical protein